MIHIDYNHYGSAGPSTKNKKNNINLCSVNVKCDPLVILLRLCPLGREEFHREIKKKHWHHSARCPIGELTDFTCVMFETRWFQQVEAGNIRTIYTAVVVWCPRILGHFSMECLLSVTDTATTRMTEGSHSTLTAA